MFAIKTRRRIALFIPVLGVWLAVALALAVFLPREGTTKLRSFFAWALIVPVALISYAALEAGGSWLLSRPFIEKRSSGARIAIVLAVCLLIIGAIVAAVHIGEAYAP